jgi:Uma2 family endonuclease
MASTAPHGLRRHRLSVADYFRMGETGICAPDARVELIDGEIIDMAPIGSLHAGTLRRLGRIVERAVGDAAIVSVQNPVLLGTYSAPQPDIALLWPRDDFYIHAHPESKDILLVIEVSDATLTEDRTVKARLYAQAGIPEYWVFDVQHQAVIVFREPHDGRYTIELSASGNDILTVQQLPQVTFPVSAIF